MKSVGEVVAGRVLGSGSHVRSAQCDDNRPPSMELGLVRPHRQPTAGHSWPDSTMRPADEFGNVGDRAHAGYVAVDSGPGMRL